MRFTNIVFLFVFSLLYSAEILFVDDFNSGVRKNKLGGNSFVLTSSEEIYCEISFSSTEYVEEQNGMSLRLYYKFPSEKHFLKHIHKYNQKSKNSKNLLQHFSDEERTHFCAYLTKLNGVKLKGRFNYLNLFLKGEKGGNYTRKVIVELKDKKNTEKYVLEGITDKWQKFTIPLKYFRNINLSSIEELVILLLSEEVTRPEGIIYIDNIYFSKSK